MFSDDSEPGCRTCSKSSDSDEYFLSFISLSESYECLEFWDAIYCNRYIILYTAFEESLIFWTICCYAVSSVSSRDCFREFSIRWHIDTTVHLFTSFENSTRSINLHNCMNLRTEAVSREYFFEICNISFEILWNNYTNRLDFRVKYGFYFFWNHVFCYLHGNWKDISIWFERFQSGVFI